MRNKTKEKKQVENYLIIKLNFNNFAISYYDLYFSI